MANQFIGSQTWRSSLVIVGLDAHFKMSILKRMARPIEFDEDHALVMAMEAFRRHGYGGVSIKDLEHETGQSSGSLYNSFGNKEALFRRVLEKYNRLVVQARISEHFDGSEPLKSLLAFFLSTLDEPGGGALGCLLTNSAVEFAGAGAAEISDGFGLQARAFEQQLLRLGHGRRARKNAVRLLAFYQGVLVLVRHGYDKAKLAPMIRAEIRSIAGGI